MAYAQRRVQAKSEKHRNARVHHVDREEYKRDRNVRFRRAVNWASLAKATRTHFEVTQAEVAAYLDLSVTSIIQRENGFHAWSGGAAQFDEYQRAVATIARRAPRRG
jgi:DNA-binding XRE family transcriptional regulator